LIVEELSIYTEKSGFKKTYIRFNLVNFNDFYLEFKKDAPPQEVYVSIPLEEMPNFDSYVSGNATVVLIDFIEFTPHFLSYF